MSFKETKIIDLNLFSGSSELLRQAAFGYYGDFEGTGEINFQQSDILLNINGVLSVEESEITSSTFTVLPSIKYASRLFVDESYGFVSDEEWKTFVVGGTYQNQIYTGLYNDSVYADHYNTSSLPYVPREIVNISEDVLTPSLSLTTEYYNYYSRYQSTVGRLDSELSAPNFYLLDSSSYLQPQDKGNTSTQSRYAYEDLAGYLSSSYVNSEKTLDTNLQNIFVLDDVALERNTLTRLDTTDLNGHFDGDLESLYSLMPFGNKLEISSELARPDNDYRKIIEDNNYKVKFIKILKEVFQGESNLQPSAASFAINTQAETSTGILTGSLQTTQTTTVNILDVPTMLLYSYRNPISETNNIVVLNSSSYESEIAYSMNPTGSYRYQNTSASLAVLNDFILEAKTKFEGSTDTYPLNNFLNAANNPKHNETIAYRIEKIGGAPTGDSRTQNTIQNIWFYNNDQTITYFDTQVKYNTEYTYKIYKYDIVQGYKYQLSDAVTTRQLATESSAEGEIYCLEFYDPFSGERRNRVLSEPGFPAEFIANATNRFEDLNSLNNIITFAITRIQPTTTIISTDLATEAAAIIADTSNSDVVNSDTYAEEFATYNAYPYYVKTINVDYESSLPEIGQLQIDYYYFGQDAIDWYKNDLSSDPSVEGTLQTVRTDSVSVVRWKQILLGAIITLEDLRDDTVAPLLDEALQTYELVTQTNDLASAAQINSIYPYLADFNITIEPSLKIIEIPLEEKSMRIVDHPPNDFVITPHHLLDQSNRLAFFCKYDTFSQNAVTYPTALNARDTSNKTSYLTGNDFLEISEQTQESVSRPRFIEVYRTTTKPTSYDDFSGNLRTTIDLKQENGDIPTDHLFVERVRDNTIYYYVFRSLNENGVAGQFSPVFESELINDGGYVYGRFQQHSEDDLAVTNTKDPLSVVKKLFNIVPNMQHLVLDSSNVDLDNPAVSEIDNVSLGSSNLTDPLFTDANRYFKIRLTSKKTGRKLDINIGFKKEVRK